ncbi:MAG TPA: hypothetical protein VLH79_08735 [Chthonomonadales bacterium]|nr:hypothetical protein [Chthonomonadales bacterium]
MVMELDINEVKCFECGREIPSIPRWLSKSSNGPKPKVKFECEDCRQKHPRMPGAADLDAREIREPEAAPAAEVVEDDAEVDEDQDDHSEE